jgi:hypothetical protein
MWQGRIACGLFLKLKPSFIPHSRPTNSTPNATPLKIEKLTMEEMIGCQLKVLCYNCDDKYFSGHKCKEQKIFMAIFEDFSDREIDVHQDEELPQEYVHSSHSDPLEVELLISLNSINGIFAPQTLNLIKHRKFIILVDIRNTHNFNHHRIS